jgi:DNA polymerase-3 subunit delta'
MSMAMDLARAVNCEAADPANRPCGACKPCQRITRGLHADVRVIDPETTIESEKPRPGEEDRTRRVIRKGHIDDLHHRAALKPFEGRSQVFVIDGADLMQASAANALLKTLEEPESQVLLVLLTSAPGALPETIISRCQRVELRPIPAGVIERHLVEVAGAEPALALTLARASQGRPGWAIAALADPTALEGRRQSMQRILGVLAGTFESRFRYARALTSAHRKEREAIAEEMAVWTGLLRDVLMAQHDRTEAIANQEFLAEIEAIAKAISTSAITGAIRAINGTLGAVERNAMMPLVFDVLMLDLPRADPSTLPSITTEGADESTGPSPDDSAG